MDVTMYVNIQWIYYIYQTWWFSRHFLENELSESDSPVYLQNSKYTLRRNLLLNNYLHFSQFSFLIRSMSIDIIHINKSKVGLRWQSVVKTPMLPAGAWVLSLVEEPRSYMPFGKTKKKKAKNSKSL